MNQGVLEAQRGDLSAAIPYWQEAKAIGDANGKPSWVARQNLGLADRDLGRWQAAVEMLTDALETLERKGKEDSTQIATVTVALGPAYAAIGELDRANETIEHAVRAARSAGVPLVREALAWTALIAIARAVEIAARDGDQGGEGRDRRAGVGRGAR